MIASADLSTLWLLGDPVAHSLSPLIQNSALRELGQKAVYLAARVDAADLLKVVDALPRLGALGANITVPHKVAVLQACTELTDRARAIGAANTLAFRNGAVLGDNTDGVGWWHSLWELRERGSFEQAIVIGAGGAARAVVYTLLEHGVDDVQILNRSTNRAEELAEDMRGQFPSARLECRQLSEFARLLRSATLVVQTTSVGLDSADSPVEMPAELPKDVYLSELIYGRSTPLMRDFENLGGTVVDGLGMLVGQAVHALALWLELDYREIPADLMMKVARDRLRDQRDF